MTEYRYDLEIGVPLLKRIAEELRLSESVCLLGPRDVGKRWVIHRLADALKSPPSRVVARLELDRLRPHDHGSLAAAVAAEARRAGWSGAAPADRFPPLLQPLTVLASELGTRLVLLAANVDNLPHDLAVRLLHEIQAGVFARHFDVVLTGEAHLRELVTEETSPFRCTRYFILQRFDRTAFQKYVETRCAALGITLDEPLADFLYAQTNGQIHPVRHLLWAAKESQLRWKQDAEGDIAALIRSEEFARVIEIYGLDLFHRAARLIEEDEGESLGQLGELLAGESPLASPTRPTPLELSGLVSRCPAHRLSFSSPLARQFATGYFTARRWGDILARQGRTAEAIAHYQTIAAAERTPRPVSGEDASHLRGALESFGSAMQRRALGEPPLDGTMLDGTMLERLRRDFEANARHFLGYRHVVFARRAHGGVWAAYAGDVNDGLLVEEVRRLGAASAGPQWRENVFLHLLPGLRGDAAEAVLVRDGDGPALRAEQRRLLEELTQFFFSAFAHVTRQIRVHESSLRGQHFRDIAMEIATVLHHHPAPAKDIVQRAAKLLVERFGFRRVMFSLVDSRRETIAGTAVWPRREPRDHGEFDNLRLVLGTAYHLVNDRGRDVQVDAINEPERYLVADVERPACVINAPLVAEARMTHLAVLPLQGARNSDAVGTIHLERADGTLPTEDELLEIEAFARQVALLLEQCERTNLLLGGLDATRDPMIILDARARARYANQPAAELFGLKEAGWQGLDGRLAWPERFSRVEQALRNSVLDEGKEYLAFLERRPEAAGVSPGENTYRVHLAPFDFRGDPAAAISDAPTGVEVTSLHYRSSERGGAVLHCLHFDHLCAIREAFVAISEAVDETSLWCQIGEAAIRLGLTSGRIYRVEDRGNTLRCCWAFNRDNPDAALRYRRNPPAFPRGLSSALSETWRCFRPEGDAPASEPLVLGHFPDLPEGGQIDARGINFYNLLHTELRKPPGTLWLDIPMLREGKPFAKITLDCPPEYPPERIALLRLLFRLLNAMLDARLLARTTEDLRAAFEQLRKNNLHFAFHTVTNFLRPLASVLCAYELLPAGTPGVQEINVTFQNQFHRIMDDVSKLARRLGVRNLQCERLDFSQLVREWQQQMPGSKKSTLVPRMPELVIEADPVALRVVLDELYSNSAAALPDGEEPRVELSLTLVKDMAELRFRDHGPGIAPAHRARVFDILFTHRPGRPGRHQGIGLSEVRQICEQHRGHIELDSCIYDPERCDPRGGAGFIIRLPLAASSNSEPPQDPFASGGP